MNLQKMAKAVRFLSADMVEKAKSGHPGMPLGMADVATVLWAKFLKFDATNPDWPDRDRFVLSNGHGSALLYSLLYLTGFPGYDKETLKRFRQFSSLTPGHPEKGVGVDFSTGPLAQGLAGAVGMALAEKMQNARYTDALVHHKTYVFVGDGCLMEGLSEETLQLAGRLNLNKLIVLWDDNRITIDGAVQSVSVTDQKKRFEASGWQVLSCDGHDFDSIEKALNQAQTAMKPTMIACKTTIGFGAPHKSGTSKAHGSPLGADEIQGMRHRLEWFYPPFEVPEDILNDWRSIGCRSREKRRLWEERLKSFSGREAFLNEQDDAVFKKAFDAAEIYKNRVISEKPVLSTRQASQNALSVLTEHIPQLIGGSADLSASCLTMTPDSRLVTVQDFSGNYIEYGIREHAMAGIMNGLAAYGGIIPYGSTFLSFSDYMKPAVRLGCLMHLKEIYVLTHDSIAVGEDGPTHQPIEQLAMLRATPNLLVFRPADGIEVMESYETALTANGPSALVLSRQNLPTIRSDAHENKTAFGAYVLYEPEGGRDVTLLTTGSEVSLALQAKDLLNTNGVRAAVVSMPCWALFEKQSAAYQATVLGTAPRVAIEAASSFGWDRFIGDVGAILSIDTFGKSAPGSELLEKFGFTKENITQVVLKVLTLV